MRLPHPPEKLDSTSPENVKPRRLRRLFSLSETAKSLMRNPRDIAPITGRALLGIWRSRGGGWYGVGYLLVFITLEIRLLAAEISEATDLLTFMGEQLLESLFRMLTGSLENMVLAFMWPFKVIEYLGTMYGVTLLVIIHLLFEHILRPIVEQHLPELKADRIAREEKKEEKKQKKKNKKSNKKQQ